MPRNYQANTTGGTNMVGRAYTPQVTPWDRDDDDVSTLRGRSHDRDYRRNNSSVRDEDDYRYGKPDQAQRGAGGQSDAYDRQDLTPTYGEIGDRSRRNDDDDRRYRTAEHDNSYNRDDRRGNERERNAQDSYERDMRTGNQDTGSDDYRDWHAYGADRGYHQRAADTNRRR